MNVPMGGRFLAAGTRMIAARLYVHRAQALRVHATYVQWMIEIDLIGDSDRSRVEVDSADWTMWIFSAARVKFSSSETAMKC